MKPFLIVLLFAVLQLSGAKLVISKVSKSNLPKNAIIAIQIIDPNENATNSKNSKRTIESSLGYGYQGNFIGKQSAPKYEIYKYSQHDIPPYNPSQYTVQQTSNYHSANAVSKPVQHTGGSNVYQPGTIWFSTINQHGQLGDLSSQFPVSLEDQQYPIPVIILRVHPDQLANPLYPKLPQNHLHASTINSIDINSLLSNYIQSGTKQQQPAVQQQPVYQQHQQEEYQNSQTYVQPQAEAVQYQHQEYQAPDYQSQQYYPQYQYEETQDVSQSYQSPHDVSAQVSDTGSNYQYNSYQVASPAYQQAASLSQSYKPELLIDENYPSDKHTQVIFKRSKGKSSSRNKHVHRSAPQVPTIKSQVSSEETQQTEKPVQPIPKRYQPSTNYYTEETQPQNEKLVQPIPKRYQPNTNYYTIQYPDDQSQNEKSAQPVSKYYQPNTNYYTIQYSDDQGYTHQKASSYAAKDQEEQPYKGLGSRQSQNYVYVSTDPMYNPHV